VGRSGEGAKGATAGAAQPEKRSLLRRVTVVAFAAIGLACLAGASRVWAWRQQKLAVAALRDALRGYSECMFGAPLLLGETATARLRRIEAGLPELEASPGSPPVSPWPLRCRDDLDRAHAIIAAHERLTRDPRVQRMDALLLRARADPTPSDAPDLVDDLLHAASEAGVPAVSRQYPPPSRGLAPPPASPLAAESLPPLPIRAHSAPDELRGGDPMALYLSFVDNGVRSTCVFSQLHGEPLREARCGEATPGVVSITREEAPRGAGYLRTARGRFDRFELVRWVPGADLDVTPLPTSAVTVGLYHDELVWVTSHRWFARTVTPGHAPLGPPVELGEISGKSPELSACSTSGALVVGVRTFDPALPERTAWQAMAALEAGMWRRTPGRAAVDVGATFTCDGHSGTWAWLDRHVLTEAACNADRCETRTSGPITLSWDVGGSLFVADLGGRALVLGLGTTPGPLTGKSVTSVRMRMAPLSAIAAAPDVVLFSDQAHDGAPVVDVAVYVRDMAAIVLLTGDPPLPYRAIRVDALGDFAPVTLAN